MEIEKKKLKSRQNAKRYGLHKKVKAQGYKIAVRSRTIYIPYDTNEISDEAAQLRENFKYQIQYEIT